MNVLATYTQAVPKIWNNGPQTGYWRMIVLPSGKVRSAGDFPSPSSSIFSRTAAQRGVGEGLEAVLYIDGDDVVIASSKNGKAVTGSETRYKNLPEVFKEFEVELVAA